MLHVPTKTHNLDLKIIVSNHYSVLVMCAHIYNSYYRHEHDKNVLFEISEVFFIFLISDKIFYEGSRQ